LEIVLEKTRFWDSFITSDFDENYQSAIEASCQSKEIQFSNRAIERLIWEVAG
jgi:hypothetical protein